MVRKDEDVAAWQKEWSPTTYARGRPPVLLIHGTVDPKVPFENSVRLQRVLEAAGVSCDLVPVQGGDHAMDSWSSLDSRYADSLIAWLKRTLN